MEEVWSRGASDVGQGRVLRALVVIHLFCSLTCFMSCFYLVSFSWLLAGQFRVAVQLLGGFRKALGIDGWGV